MSRSEISSSPATSAIFEVDTDSCTNANGVGDGSDVNGVVVCSSVRLKKLIFSRQVKLLLLQVRIINAHRAIHEKNDENCGELRATMTSNTQSKVWQCMHRPTAKTVRDEVKAVGADGKNRMLKMRYLRGYRRT